MSFNTCPIATVEAPIEQVWRLLADPCTPLDGQHTRVGFG